MTCIAPEVDLIADELVKTQSPQNPRRTGKIARLPKEIRDMLNRMLDDGIPYHVIIDELGEHGRGLNHQNITNWVQGGYQDHLKHLQAVDRAKAIVEAVVDFLRENGDTDLAQIRRACNYLASIQLFDALRHHGDETLKRLFQATPSKYLNVVHTLCHLSDSTLKVEKHRLQQDLVAARNALSSQIKVDQASAESPDQLQSAVVAPSQPENQPSSLIKVDQGPAKNAAQLQSAPPPYDIPLSSPIKVNQGPVKQSDQLQLAPPSPALPASSLIKVDQASAENPALNKPVTARLPVSPSPHRMGRGSG